MRKNRKALLANEGQPWDCCPSSPAEGKAPSTCPRCGGKGEPVEEVTLKALLRGPALERHSEQEHRFCPTGDCPVVYFGAKEVFRQEDITVPVFQKEPPGERTVCYCFEITEPTIRRELNQTGRSSVAQKITALVKADRCACEFKNPQGSCCLGNVRQAVKEALDRKQLLLSSAQTVARTGGWGLGKTP